MSAILLVQTSEGGLAGVRFPTVAAARAWQDEHDAELLVVRCLDRLVKPGEALELSR